LRKQAVDQRCLPYLPWAGHDLDSLRALRKTPFEGRSDRALEVRRHVYPE
jgi:hypothetical protein